MENKSSQIISTERWAANIEFAKNNESFKELLKHNKQDNYVTLDWGKDSLSPELIEVIERLVEPL